MGNRQDYRTNHEKSWDWVHPVVRKLFTSLYGYVDTSYRQNYIGAEAAAFTTQMLPLTEWKGPGEVVLKQLIATAPQVYVTQQVIPTGLAGIAAGQVWNGGLTDNPAASDTLAQEIV